MTVLNAVNWIGLPIDSISGGSEHVTIVAKYKETIATFDKVL
jgi:hypothetical protein